ncbi:MAG: hypothetical protein ACYC49_10530 [Ignavibacteriaceae bacterium]
MGISKDGRWWRNGVVENPPTFHYSTSYDIARQAAILNYESAAADEF